LERQEQRCLRTPAPPASTPNIAVGDDQRLAAVGLLLHDPRIEPRLRLAGCLVALYAQPVARIVRLTTDHLAIGEDLASVRLGDEPAALPRPLCPVVEMAAAIAQDGWLFPGQKPGQPMHPSHLSRRLRSLGIPVARTRPAGLAALAHRIPAPVAADMLGLSTASVRNTAGEVNTDYARYVAWRT
jgi:hypothetical protein